MNHFQVDFMPDEVANVVDAVLDHGRPRKSIKAVISYGVL